MRNPHGVAQIWSCWAHESVGVMFCKYVPGCGGGPPRAAGGFVVPVASDDDPAKSIVRV